MSVVTGQKGRIIDMPPKGKHLIGEVVTVIGRFSSADDDVVITTDDGLKLLVKDHQLALLPPSEPAS